MNRLRRFLTDAVDLDVIRHPRYRAWERRHVRHAVETGTLVLVVVLIADGVLMFGPTPAMAVLNVPFVAAGIALLIAIRARRGPRRNPNAAAFLIGAMALASSLLPLVLVRDAGPILVTYVPVEIIAMALFVPWNHIWHAAWTTLAVTAVVGVIASPLGQSVAPTVSRDLLTVVVEAAVISFAGHHVLQRQRRSMFLQRMQVRGLNQLATTQEQDLRALADELRAVARVDSLTGVANRLRLDEDLAAGARRAFARDGGAALMVDIDRFKNYNDSNGHLAGDAVLRRVAAALTAQTRTSDRVYRYGGEEFVVLLPGASAAEAALIAERQRAAVASLGIPTGRPDALDGEVVTVSLGVAPIEAGDVGSRDPTSWVNAADEAMYASKLAGRNRVTVARPARLESRDAVA
jgi:diguanylate cyclase (GGDEF)-like protein